MARLKLFLVVLALCGLGSSFELEAKSNPYSLSNISYTDTGITATATFQLGLGAGNETIISHLFLNITYDTPQRLRIRITDRDAQRWEVPNDLEPYTIYGNPGLYIVTLTQSPIGISVVRTSDNKVIFNLDPTLLFRYDDQDIYFTNNLGYSINVLGFGERICPFVLPVGTYTLWARDRPSPIDDGQSQVGNMYSSQPFYMIIDNDSGSAFGGLLYNSNAMSVQVNPTSINFRTTGGIIDLFLFIGPEPDDVIFQYQQLIGTPTLSPYWSYGWHQSRYGYQNVSVLNTVLNNYNFYNIPLDAVWSDIDYMYLYQNFVLDPVRYPRANMTAFINTLHRAGKKYVPIVDAGISQNTSYSTYATGLSKNLYITSPYNLTTPPTPTVGVVWPGNSTFVDWFNPAATNYWAQQLVNFQSSVAFDGVWIDMNEASNFVNGEVGHSPTLINSTTMPWTPGEDLNTRSLDVAAIHYGNVLEYNAHSLLGYYEAKATNAFYTQVQQSRPFILSRSSFPGHGRYAQKWTGDNYSAWAYLEYSITSIFNLGMFGIAMTGADICGFLGNTNEELCSRWMQLGTLYPFSRNHNDIDSVAQEPWTFGPTLLTTSKISIRNKYMLYLYFYTQMTLLSVDGGMFFKPTYFEYPTDLNLLFNATTSFMLGKALIVHPCLWPGSTGETSFFPDDNWYDFYTGEYQFLDYDNTVYLEMPLPGLINIHITTGHIVPILDNYNTALSSVDTRKSNITLIITQSGTYDATGSVIFDDGISNDNLNAGQYTQIEYSFYSYNSTFDIFTLTSLSFGYDKPANEWPYISTLIFYGCTAVPEAVYKFSKGVTTAIPITTYWKLEDGICKIWLNGSLQPNEYATLFIDYYI